MSEHTKKRQQKRRRHDVHDGDVARVFVCKPYGREFTAIRMVVLNLCIKNPTRGGKRSPAQ